MKRNVFGRLEWLEQFVSTEGVVSCKLEADMVAAGWTKQDIDDWDRACALAEEQLADELPDFRDLSIGEILDRTCHRATDLVQSPSLLALLTKDGYMPTEQPKKPASAEKIS